MDSNAAKLDVCTAKRFERDNEALDVKHSGGWLLVLRERSADKLVFGNTISISTASTAAADPNCSEWGSTASGRAGHGAAKGFRPSRFGVSAPARNERRVLVGSPRPLVPIGDGGKAAGQKPIQRETSFPKVESGAGSEVAFGVNSVY